MGTIDYKPAPHVLDRLRQVDFVAVIGPTASGKNAVLKAAKAIAPELHEVINNTSRAPRAEERNGVDYHFLTRREMQMRIDKGEYAQVAPSVFGDLYATHAQDYATDGYALLPVLAEAVHMFEALPFKSMRCIYILPPNWSEWQRRIVEHHFSPELLVKRLAEAERSLTFALSQKDMTYLINDDLAETAKHFVDIVLGAHAPTSHDTEQARDLAKTLLHRLQAAR